MFYIAFTNTLKFKITIYLRKKFPNLQNITLLLLQSVEGLGADICFCVCGINGSRSEH